MRIAMMGTRGVPAQYGGFETAVEEVGKRLVKAGHEVVVYCRYPGQTMDVYEGMTLINLPAVRRRSLETLSHTGLSVAHAVTRMRPDVAVLFNAANAPFVPVLRAAGIPTAVHLDGLEWRRAKWRGLGAHYYRQAERWSVRWADEVIADARGIADHVRLCYDRESVFLPYGAPLVSDVADRLSELGLSPRGYHLVVARFEPENHVDVIVEGYRRSAAKKPLVVIGTAPYAHSYGDKIRRIAEGDHRIRNIGAVWDQELLDQLYAGCLSYVHGHSVGGTNPSLLRAMGAGAPVTAYDVVFNREVTDARARYFSSADDVASAVEADESDTAQALRRGVAHRQFAQETYRWDDVADGYESLCLKLAGLKLAGSV
jgi:glycosyltransferase involved in cell wall biosynthesis